MRVPLIKTGVMMNWHSYYTNGPNKRRRKAIPATCGLHRGPIGFANLLVSMQDGSIVLDPHVLRHEALCSIPYRVGRDWRNISGSDG